MPKISKQTIRIQTKGVNRSFDVQLMYSAKVLFYISLPTELNAAFDHLSAEELKSYSARIIYKSSWDRSSDSKRVVTATSAEACIEAAKTIISELIDKVVTKRKVIIVWFANKNEKDDKNRYNRWNDENPNIFPDVGMEFNFTYAEETDAGGKEKIYLVHSLINNTGSYTEVTMGYNKNYVVLNDMPEYRIFLEDLHRRIYDLANKLAVFTETKEKLIRTIDSNQKLLQ